jgi:hypothetical protein
MLSVFAPLAIATCISTEESTLGAITSRTRCLRRSISAFDSVTCVRAVLRAADSFTDGGVDGVVEGNLLIGSGEIDEVAVGEAFAIVAGDLVLGDGCFCNRAKNGRGSRRTSQGVAFQGMLLSKEDGVSLVIDAVVQTEMPSSVRLSV